MILSEDLEMVDQGIPKFKVVIEKDESGIDINFTTNLTLIEVYAILSSVTNKIVGEIHENSKDQQEKDS